MADRNGAADDAARTAAHDRLTAGGAAMYQAMTALGFATESKRKGPVDLSGAPRGASVLILGAGIAGMTAAYELRNAGYHGAGARVQRAAGRPQLDAARRRHVHGARRRDAELPLRRRALRQSRSVAACRITTSTCSTIAASSASSSSRSSRSTTTPMCTARPRSAASRMRCRAYQAGFQRPRRRAAREIRASSTASMRRSAKRMARCCSKRCSSGARSTRTIATSKATTRSDRRGYARDPGGGLSARPRIFETARAEGRDPLAALAITWFDSLYEFQQTLFQPVGGMGRIGEAFGARARQAHPLPLARDANRAGRARRHRVLRRHRQTRHDAEARAPTGACARFRCRS